MLSLYGPDNRPLQRTESRSTEGLVGEFIDYIYSLDDQNVGPTGVYRLSVAFQCITIYANIISGLKINVKTTDRNGNEEIQRTGTLAEIAEYPCGESLIQGKALFWDSIVRQLKGRSNAFAWIDRSDLNINKLVWLPSEAVTMPETSVNLNGPYRVSNGRRYGVPDIIPQDRMLHFRENTLYDPLRGVSPVKLHSDQFSVAKSQDAYGKNVLRKGLRLSGVIEMPLRPGPEEINKMEDRIVERTGGTSGKNFFTIPGGGSWKNVLPMSPVDMDYIRAKELSRSEIADIFNVPVALLAGTSKGFSYNNLQAMDLRFLKYSLGPTLRGMESEMNLKLSSRGGPKFCFDTKSLLAMTIQDQVTTLTKGLNGIITTNEARREMGYPEIGEEGDIVRAPLNQGPLGGEEEPVPEPAPQPDEDRSKVPALRFCMNSGKFSRG